MSLSPPLWLETVLQTLNNGDVCVIENALPASLCAELRDDLMDSPLRPAAVGRGPLHQHAQHIRNDSSHWLDGSSPAQQAYLAAMDALRLGLNQHFFLGLDDYEAHYARYPVGGFYQRHLDSFRGNNPRRVTTVFYLNENWSTSDAGELVIYRGEHDHVGQVVLPVNGNLVIFISEAIPHEVKPAQRERLSIAGWFRVRQ